MASIDRRQVGHYRARWREYPGAPQRTKQFRCKKEAELFLDAVRGDLAQGKYVGPAGGLTLFRDYAEQCRARQVHRPSTAAKAESYLRIHAYPFLGHRPLGSIRRSEVQAWVKGRSEVLVPGSVEVVYRWVSAIFKAAVGDQLIGASPCNRIALPKREDGEVLPLTAAQVQQMADACPDRYRALVVLAAGTGSARVSASDSAWTGSTSSPSGPGQSPAARSQGWCARVRAAAEQGRIPDGPPARRGEHGAGRTPRPVRDGSVGSDLQEQLRHAAPAEHGWRDVAPCGREGGTSRVGDVPRPPALLRLAPHQSGLLGQDRSATAWPPVGHGDPRHLRPPLARQ